MKYTKYLFFLFLFITISFGFIQNVSAATNISLGGLDLNSYCTSLHQLNSHPAGITNWRCNPSEVQIDISLACQQQYHDPTAFAKQLDPYNPYTWKCFAPPPPTPSPTPVITPNPTPSLTPTASPSSTPIPSPQPTASPSGTLVGIFNGYKLYDDGISTSLFSVGCTGVIPNNNGISFQSNGRNSDIVWNGHILATISPPEEDQNPLSNVQATGMNESMQIIGEYHNHDYPTSAQNSAFFWQNGVFKVIAQGYSGHGGRAYGINNKGYVIGSIGLLSGFIWKDDVYYDLGQLAGAPYHAVPRCLDEFNNMNGDSLGPNPEFNYHLVHWVPVNPPTDKNLLVPFIGEYFDNQTLSGEPKLVRIDSKINVATNGPFEASLPLDHFSVRWSKTQFMKAGKYNFTIKADDGIRFWVDGNLLVDDWTNHPMRTYTPNITVTEGNHSLKVEYFDNTDSAVAILNEDSY